jgi:hypothetical protein
MENQADSPEAFSDEESPLFCWLNPSRQCGLDCVSYDTRAISGDTESASFFPCVLINIFRLQAQAMAKQVILSESQAKQAAGQEIADKLNIPPPAIR